MDAEEVNTEDVDEAQEEAIAWKGLLKMQKLVWRRLREDDFILHVKGDFFGGVGRLIVQHNKLTW